MQIGLDICQTSIWGIDALMFGLTFIAFILILMIEIEEGVNYDQ